MKKIILSLLVVMPLALMAFTDIARAQYALDQGVTVPDSGSLDLTGACANQYSSDLSNDLWLTSDVNTMCGTLDPTNPCVQWMEDTTTGDMIDTMYSGLTCQSVQNLITNSCSPGSIQAVGNQSYFCNTSGTYQFMNADGAACANNYECLSNSCVAQTCQGNLVFVPPVINSIADQSVPVNTTLTLAFFATGPIGDTLTYSVSSNDIPQGSNDSVTLNTATSTWQFTWTPTTVGTYQATITVTDRKTGMTDSTIFNINVYTSSQTPPTGSIAIDPVMLNPLTLATYTNNPNAYLALSATDPGSGMGIGAQMQFSNDNSTWSTPEPYNFSKINWLLTSSDGAKTVYVKFKDAAGNWSQAFSSSIILATTPPTGTISINNGASVTNNLNVNLALSASDTEDAVTQMQFFLNNGSWSAPVPYASTSPLTLTSGDGPQTVSVMYQDAAGNWSPTYSSTILLDTTPPVGTINSSAWANSTNVVLNLSATDAGSGMSMMKFSNDGITWSIPQAYATTANWTMASVNGPQTVYAMFSDVAGNWSQSYSGTVNIDNTPPAGSITINGGAQTTTSTTVNLTLSATDTQSGMGTGAQMEFLNDNSTWSSPVAYATTYTNWTLSNTNGQNTVYVKFKDVAGNWSQAYSSSITLAMTPPTGTIKINNGASVTNSLNVTLDLSATDAQDSVTQMKFSNNNGTWSASVSYATTYSWTLASGDGPQTVSVMYQDAAGNWSQAYSSTILLDTTPPSGNIVINNGAQTTSSQIVSLTLSATDAQSGMGTGAQMEFSNDGSTWSTQVAYAIGYANWTLSNTDGSKTVYVKFKDAAGNWSQAYSSSITLATTPPTGTIKINNGASVTNSLNVTLDLSATDAQDSVTQMKFSNNNGTWSASVSYATTYSWTLASGDGPQTVSVMYQDAAGSWSQVYSSSITLATTPPTGTIKINNGASVTNSLNVTLDLSATDAQDSVTQMKFSNNNGTWSASVSYATTYSWTLASGDGPQTVSVMYQDAAGNWSQAYSSTILLDTIPPSGNIVINNGAQSTSSQIVSLTLSATDAQSGMGPGAQMQFSNDDSTWSTQVAYATSYAGWALSNGNGQKTVYVRFMDTAGNWSTGTISSTISLNDTLTGTISINNGTLTTNSLTVTLELSATGANRVTFMQFSNNGSIWSSPQVYATTTAWTLSSGDALKTVYVRFEDSVGNWSQAYSSTITSIPTGTISIRNTVNGNTAWTNSLNVNLNLSATEVGNGVVYMKFSNDNVNWSALYTYASTAPWTLSSGADGVRKVYAMFRDVYGTWSAPCSSTILLDTTSPSGSITINNGAGLTASQNVTLTLSAVDAGSGMGAVAQMEFSNNGSTWSSPVAYATSYSGWVLSSGDGQKTVYVKFKDAAGNWSQAFLSTINFNPQNGICAAAGEKTYDGYCCQVGQNACNDGCCSGKCGINGNCGSSS